MSEPDPIRRGHETSDASIRGILAATGGLLLALVIILVVVRWYSGVAGRPEVPSRPLAEDAIDELAETEAWSRPRERRGWRAAAAPEVRVSPLRPRRMSVEEAMERLVREGRVIRTVPDGRPGGSAAPAGSDRPEPGGSR